MTAHYLTEHLTAAVANAGDTAELLAAAAVDQLAGRPRDLLTLLRTLEDARKSLQQAEALVKDAIAGTMGRGRLLELPGVAVVERRPGGRRKEWDSPLLAQAVVAQALEPYDPGQEARAAGEADTFEAMTVAAQLAREALEVAARLEWRSTGVKALGLDPDRYCTIERGRDTLAVTWADKVDEPLDTVTPTP